MYLQLGTINEFRADDGSAAEMVMCTMHLNNDWVNAKLLSNILIGCLILRNLDSRKKTCTY